MCGADEWVRVLDRLQTSLPRTVRLNVSVELSCLTWDSFEQILGFRPKPFAWLPLQEAGEFVLSGEKAVRLSQWPDIRACNAGVASAMRR